ncbi:MAG: VOC family protein [Cytophagales bacterium]
MKTLNPYIMFNGNAREAMGFYSKCFGGKLEIKDYEDVPEMKVDEKDLNKIMHAALITENAVIMACDDLSLGKSKPIRNIQLSIECISESELTRYFFVLAENGDITMPLQDTFWGARFGMVTDQFGVKWMLSYERH